MSEPAAGAALPRVLLVGRGRVRFPLGATAERRYGALSAQLDWRQLGTRIGDAPADPRFVLAPEPPVGALRGAWFYAALPLRVARELRAFRPAAVIAQGPQETALALLGRRLGGTGTPVVLDLHGDWRAPTRLYGSPARRVLARLADALARFALRHADAVRTITPYTSGLVRDAGREPDAEFPAFMDVAAFTETPPAPLPESPRALFIGVLERYKAVDVLADAWRVVVASAPDATLRIVGRGTLSEPVARLVADLGPRVRWDTEVPTNEVARALDEATVLVLPSRSEGMGRVVVEAFCRGRGVVASKVGGIPDLVADGRNGLLVPPGDADALAAALLRVLTDRPLAERLGCGASSSAPAWSASPEAWAERLRALVDDVAGKAGR